MDKLLGDLVKTEISNEVMDILRAFQMSNWHSELYQWNQNSTDWRYRTIESWTNTIMNRSGATAYCWLLCLIYVCYLLNHIACAALGGLISLFVLYGIIPHISILLLSHFHNQCIMLPMISIFLQKVRKEHATLLLSMVMQLCHDLAKHCGPLVWPSADHLGRMEDVQIHTTINERRVHRT